MQNRPRARKKRRIGGRGGKGVEVGRRKRWEVGRGGKEVEGRRERRKESEKIQRVSPQPFSI